MKFSRTMPLHVYEGEDVLITCVVQDIGDNVVMWKKQAVGQRSIELTAGDTRVTPDKRIDVLHDPKPENSQEVTSRGDVWVLVIRDALPSDSGVYVCEVNSSPEVRSFHSVTVYPADLQPPNSDDGGGSSTSEPLQYVTDEEGERTFSSRSHNYTDCCVAMNVSSSCLGFCSIQNIIEGNTGQGPENCEQDFPSIVRCMADGRNHVPCCIQERVPDICQDVCRGEYTAITDNIKTHFSCSAYTEQTLACIVEGIELLPSPPQDVEVRALTEKSLNISWQPPLEHAATLKNYIINVTALRSFDDRPLSETTDPTPVQNLTAAATAQQASGRANTTHYGVSARRGWLVLGALRPFTVYDVSVVAQNAHGTSMPSYTVRAMTLPPGRGQQPRKGGGDAPQLPDIRACCVGKGIGMHLCLDKLCDPIAAADTEITDLMICAPWANDTFNCLANGRDHTPCCKARGLPPLCQHLCTGNVSAIDFSYFKCLRYMGEYTNCLLQGYGVLASAPTRVRLTNVETEFAVVHWGPPEQLADTVRHYNVRHRMLGPDPADQDVDPGEDGEQEEEQRGDAEWRTAARVHSPHILEGLDSDTDYEVYVEAVNEHGVGEPSNRLTFRTESKVEEERLEEGGAETGAAGAAGQGGYNVTACCVEAELRPACMPLCSYSANMSAVRRLAGVCAPELHRLLRCGAGGRDHGACCARRGAPAACLPLCAGVLHGSPLHIATTCVAYIGNIVQCFEEGTELLPGPASELHATVLDETSILVEWDPPTEGANVTDYIAQYQKFDNTSILGGTYRLQNQINVTENSVILKNLETNATYHILVLSRNEHGTSLPSSVIVIHLVKPEGEKGEKVNGVPTPPHSLAVLRHSATWVTVTWQPPEFSHPSEKITYRLYYKYTSEEKYHVMNTTITSYMLMELTPNTQYIVYVVAVSAKGESVPSETLIAWTDPAYPAFVEPPTVHPINLVIEGSSMTILCIAMGTPLPTISLYVSGRLVRQETTRHMVTVIHNVTRDMDQISCYADNGYGTPMQASRKITISHGPHIQPAGISIASAGDTVTLECRVEARPAPKMLFWRSPEERTPVIQGGKFDIRTAPARDEPDRYLMQLTIKQVSEVDAGEYYCHAENAFGRETKAVSVRVRTQAPVTNITQCCLEQNVTVACMDACSFYLDIDAVIDKPECLQDFDKLMKCAADGSDHRECCTGMGVPRRCLDWCRGEPVLSGGTCVLAHTRQIMACFHQGRERLPGPPRNVRVEFEDARSVNVRWLPPVKNPHTVEMYRVFWRDVDNPAKTMRMLDTPETSVRITGLKDGTTYDAFVKAGNAKGTSTLTEPVTFTMGDKYITSAASRGDDGSHAGVAVAVVLALVVVAAIVVGAVWFIRTKKMLGVKSSNGVAFENPSYLREVNMDHIQMPNGQTETSVSNGAPNGIAISSSSGGQGWKDEALHVPTSTEVNPTLYEELKLGQDGAGFRRLKP